jgi:hypothetical protein
MLWQNMHCEIYANYIYDCVARYFRNTCIPSLCAQYIDQGALRVFVLALLREK